jgi:hypothetical protein
MRSRVLCFLLVAHAVSMLFPTSVAEAAESTAQGSGVASSNAVASGKTHVTHAGGASDEVAVEELALGPKVQTQPPSDSNTMQPRSPSAQTLPKANTAATPQATTGTPNSVTDPRLASGATIFDGVRTTVVADIRLLPRRLPYRGEKAIDGYVLDERRRWWMIIAGGALFGIGYAAAIVTGNENDFKSGMGFTAIPVAGPFIAMAAFDGGCDDAVQNTSCVDEDAKAQLALAGILQIAGAVLLPIGVFSTKQMWLREDLSVAVSPTRVGRTGYGAVLTGTF